MMIKLFIQEPSEATPRSINQSHVLAYCRYFGIPDAITKFSFDSITFILDRDFLLPSCIIIPTGSVVTFRYIDKK